MISFEEGIRLIIAHTPTLGKTALPLRRLSGRILAEDIVAPFPLPRFDNSAMDGYAVRAAEFNDASATNRIPLNVAGTIRAGDSADSLLALGTAVKIMTGAPIPPGADAVVKREDVETEAGLFVTKPIQLGDHIRRRGEELPGGVTVFQAGTRITPPVIGMLATLGIERAGVFKLPRVSVIITGDELLKAGEAVTPGRIYDANGPALAEAIKETGIHSVKVSVCGDDETQLRTLMDASLKDSDIVITVGGISVGDYDCIRRVNESLGIQERFWRLAIKPGKPIYFGTFARYRRSPLLVFGLPGNPVSALLGFDLFVKSAINKMTGDPAPAPKLSKAILTSELHKKDNRLEFVRARCDASTGHIRVTPVVGQESHMLSGLAAANCVILFHKDEEHLAADSIVDIINLHWH